MLEQAQLVLHGQVTEQRLWGVVLLVLSIATAAYPAWRASLSLNGWGQVALGLFVGSLFVVPAGMAWGKVLSWVRERWFA